MKWKALGMSILLLFILAACQNGDNTDGNQQSAGNTRNISNDLGDRNYTMERKSDRFQNTDTLRNGSGNNNYNVSDEAADRIVKEVDEIDNAFVVTTNNNAYVAATLHNQGNDRAQGNRSGNDVTDDVKNRVSEIVQSVDGNIDNVYVSTSPDFIDLADRYRNQAENGHPVEGFFDQVGNMIERLFPENRR